MNLGPITERLIDDIGWSRDEIVLHVQRSLDEDLAYGSDVTSQATVAADQRVVAQFAARTAGVLCGVGLATATLEAVIGSQNWTCNAHATDGDHLVPGSVVLSVEAPARGLLTAERTALNYLGHLSGVATLTSQWVGEVSGTNTVVRDTRKTIPGMRVLEKYAVRCGGGANHRMGLGDAALIKDNHVAAAGGVAAAVAAVRSLDAQVPLEVECDTIEQVVEAVTAGAELILLDNMSIEDLSAAVKAARAGGAEVKLEASGGLSLESVRAIAETGVDFVAVGALTHSAPVLDLGLDVVEVLGGSGAR